MLRSIALSLRMRSCFGGPCAREALSLWVCDSRSAVERLHDLSARAADQASCFILWNLPQQVRGRYRSDHRGTVAQERNHLVQVLDLQAVVERVPELMRPVEQRQHAQPEQREAREGIADHDEHLLV